MIFIAHGSDSQGDQILQIVTTLAHFKVFGIFSGIIYNWAKFLIYSSKF